MITKKTFKPFGMLSILAALLLTGCDMALMNPKGQIGMEQKSLIITATWLMLIVVIPVIVMTVYFAWKYRASNTEAEYAPDWAHSKKIEAVVWLVPCIIILILSTITWYSTHALDPRKPLASGAKPITIQVVALDWKWLFIYPDFNIATVNQIAFPTDVPVEFKITSATVMNSFFIPRLGSQLYAMAGMENRLNLIANEAGTYQGLSSNYSGAGFSGMKFSVLATSQEGFQQWLAKVRQSPQQLTDENYQALTPETINHPVQYFSSVKPGLYLDIINQFMGPGMHGSSGSGHQAVNHETRSHKTIDVAQPMHAQLSTSGE